MEIQFCPYRLKLEIQMTKLSRPVIFSGDTRDLTLLEACREKVENEEPPVHDFPETSKCHSYFDFNYFVLPLALNQIQFNDFNLAP
jgi:hypothetical protein